MRHIAYHCNETNALSVACRKIARVWSMFGHKPGALSAYKIRWFGRPPCRADHFVSED